MGLRARWDDDLCSTVQHALSVIAGLLLANLRPQIDAHPVPGENDSFFRLAVDRLPELGRSGCSRPTSNPMNSLNRSFLFSRLIDVHSIGDVAIYPVFCAPAL